MALIFISPVSNTPVGGIKVIYRQCEMLANNGVESYIFHPENPQFSCDWFAHNVHFRLSSQFDPKVDFIIIPECWAGYFGQQCINAGLHFAIYVQGGYVTHFLHGLSEEELRNIYAKADLIMSISDDTTSAILLAFPCVKRDRVIRVFYSVSSLFKNNTPKRNLITYMPRKLTHHSERLLFFLKPYLPDDWEILPITNKSESEVAEIFAESAIYLSFCEMEGCPVPPLEAAIAGNIVVGYTGEGAKEYFFKPVFREVYSGDIKNYVASVRNAIDDSVAGLTYSHAFLHQIETLQNIHSLENELFYLKLLLHKIEEIMKAT